MKLVIDIPEDLYDMICTPNTCVSLARRAGFICAAAENGTPLPKGHGRLKDVDWIDDNCQDHRTADDFSWCYTWNDIDNAPTIIEADRGEQK